MGRPGEPSRNGSSSIVNGGDLSAERGSCLPRKEYGFGVGPSMFPGLLRTVAKPGQLVQRVEGRHRLHRDARELVGQRRLEALRHRGRIAGLVVSLAPRLIRA